MTDEEMISCQEKGRQVERLRAIMHRLRAPGGCPWDAEQSHESLVSNLLEEAYEVVAAIRSGDDENLQEELGDVLLQVVFHSEIASERQGFDLDEVARGVCDKLIRRHPHVYGKNQAGDSSAVLKQWEEIKRAEKGAEEKPYLHGVGAGLPATLRGYKLQKKAAKVGFDWSSAQGIVGKIEEELLEVKEELARVERGEDAHRELEKEIGDLLFVTVNLARKLKIDPEVALEGTNVKFEKRFAYLEKRLQQRGIGLEEATLEEMNDLWEIAKTEAR
ncbi:nucleoside triphosphate pyrophosphohydrolase [Roseibacillus ishigakijimensis]|uniref:Nucleoside triphosphate pyrophosphohydrolase n=1 Tax=Roseibacillus ishigakijimensis TaxID=454146 RepID=A0A934VNW0_9BACT|nr:nucleoside triphosphate pyrophosphohydrolase [Roseibacillus ishigakijimensis]MBK1835471.1 nucleoside triphosphate pyrophosphohydrolase [Roseibacillus ishigakijimensis]